MDMEVGVVFASPPTAGCLVIELVSHCASERRDGRIAFSRSLCGLGCVLIVASIPLGCSGLSRRQNANDVVSARQIALRGLDAVQAQQWEQAEQLFAKAVDVCPADERVRWRYAEALWHRGAKAEAIEHMQQAARLSGGDPELLVHLGRMYLGNDDLPHALRIANQTIDSGHQLADAYRLRGDVLVRQAKWHEALADYHAALSIRETYPEVQMAVSRVYFEHGRPQRALSTLLTLAQSYPSAHVPTDVLYLEGLAYKQLRRYEPAISCLAQAEAHGMKTADVYFNLAEAHYLAGDGTNAGLCLRRALELRPQHVAARQLSQQLQRNRQMASLVP